MQASEIELEAGPFAGVFDSPDAAGASFSRLFAALNMRIPDPRDRSSVVARHGFLGLTSRLGSGANRTGQCLFMHRRLDGTIDRFKFCGGHMYRWDGDVTYTDITPAGIDIHPSNPIFCASYNDSLLVSDENNKPWIYDVAAATAAHIEIDDLHTNWATKGGPVVFGDKVFFILRQIGGSTLTTEAGIRLTTEDGRELLTELLSGVQNTLTWGEELDASLGYDQGNYDNLWQLTQTSNEVLGLIIAEEGALIYYRNKGIGVITGAVSEDFKASATKDTVSTTIGTDSPAAGISINSRNWFVDMDGKVYRVALGQGAPEHIWYPMRRAADMETGLSANRATVVANARVGYHEGYGLVLFTIWDRQTIYVFDAELGIYVGQWWIGDGIHIDAMGSMVDDSNRTTFCIIGTRADVYDSTVQGVVWREKHSDDADQWLDQADAASGTLIGFERAAETHWMVSDVAKTYRATNVEVSLMGSATRHAVGLEYTVPASGKSARLVAQSTAVQGVVDDEDSVSRAVYSLGKNAQGDSLRLRISATHADNVRFGINSLKLSATVTKARPKAA